MAFRDTIEPMAAVSVVETHPQRQFIIDQLLAGVGLRRIADAVSPKLTHTAIQRYANNVVKPAIRASRPQQAVDHGDIQSSGSVDVMSLQKSIQQSPVRARLEKIWEKTSDMMAEAGVDNGAPWVNAATKQVDLLARLTGELRQADGPTVNIQIVIPGSGVDLGAAPGRIDLSEAEGNCFEMGDKLK